MTVLHQKSVGKYHAAIDLTMHPGSPNLIDRSFRFRIEMLDRHFSEEVSRILHKYNEVFVEPKLEENETDYIWWVTSYHMILVYCKSFDHAWDFYDSAETQMLQAKLMV